MNPAIASRPPGEGAPTGAASPRGRLMRCLVGNQLQQAIHVAAVLRVADALADGPLDSAQLASRVAAASGPLERMLAALASFGIFERRPDGLFVLNAEAALLRDGTPDSLRPFAIWSGGVSYRAFGDLEHSVRSGTPAFEHLFGAEFFAYLSAHPHDEALFDDVMSWNTRPLCATIAARDFAAINTVVDLGGGRGDLLLAVLHAHSHVRGVLVDRRITPRTREAIARAGLESRCGIVCADILDAVPGGGDVYLLKCVLHGLDDVHALRVLKNCCRVMPAASTLLVIELLLPDGDEPSPARLMDLLMLVGCRGRERTRAEFDDLLMQAGFRSRRFQAATQAFTIIVAQ